MKATSFCAAAVLAFSLLLTGCDSKPTHESVAEDMLDEMKQMVAVLKTVKDESSAKAAEPKLKKAKERMDALQKQGDALGTPTAEQQKEMEKHKAEMEKVMGEFMGEMMRVAMNPQTSGALKDLDMK